MKAIYNTIGKSYDSSRRADPAIVKRLFKLINPQKNQRYLDVGCGSGNYTIALAKMGADITGLDVSEEMLTKARAKQSALNWIQGDAKALPFADGSFDGVLCFLAIHHIRDLSAFFSEAFRILKPNGKFLIFTNSPTQFKQLWLIEYFPKMIEKASGLLFEKDQLEKNLTDSGFEDINFEKCFVDEHTQDGFLEIAKYYPELCLEPVFQANTSPFALAPDEIEIDRGLKKLQQDIETKKIRTIIDRFPNPEGNFYYITARKNLNS